jgi:hypothetical protein
MLGAGSVMYGSSAMLLADLGGTEWGGLAHHRMIAPSRVLTTLA